MIAVKAFGTMPDGRPVSLYTLRAGAYSCAVTDLGAALVSLLVPDQNGQPLDVVLGFDRAADYLNPDNGYLGATVGRFCNRIAGSRFSLNGRCYSLPANDGPNHLHGGPDGFSFRLFSMREVGANAMRFSLHSPNGDQGYPGNLDFSVTYTLFETGRLSLRYHARSDADTIVNFTNHSYFNLNGAKSGKTVLNHTLTVRADRYCETDNACLPTGRLCRTDGGCMDFSAPVLLADRLEKQTGCIAQQGGIDHHFIANGTMPLAILSCADTGLSLSVDTDRPGLQIYTAGQLKKGLVGKGGTPYPRFGAVCMETQGYPNAPNLPAFPSALLPAGKDFSSETAFSFSKISEETAWRD